MKSNFVIIFLWISQIAMGRNANIPQTIKGAAKQAIPQTNKTLFDIGNVPKSDTVNFPEVNILYF